MAEETVKEAPKRSKEQITQEYNTLAAQSGDFNYRMELMKQDVSQWHGQMFKLSQEMRDLEKASPVEGTLG